MSIATAAQKLCKDNKNPNYARFANFIPKYERLATNCLGFDFPLYGGLPEGRLVVFAGLEHSGKTTAACTAMAAYQHKYPEKTCIYVDVEHSLDLEFQSNMTGLDLTKLLYINPENLSGEQILDDVLTLQEEDDVGLIVIDSIPALVSSRDYDTSVEEDKGMSAGIAKPLGKFIRKINGQIMAKNNILILINQVREAGKTYTGASIYTEPGGHAPKYYASVKVRFGTRTFTKGDKVDLSDGEDADGFRLKFKITKNKTASTQRGGGFITYRYDSGADWEHDLIEIAIKYEFIKRPTLQSYLLVNLNTGEAYIDTETGGELKFRGKQAMLDYFNTHIDFQNEYLKMLNEYITHTDNQYGSLLDARDNAEIDAQENSVAGNREQTEDGYLMEQEKNVETENLPY